MDLSKLLPHGYKVIQKPLELADTNLHRYLPQTCEANSRYHLVRDALTSQTVV